MVAFSLSDMGTILMERSLSFLIAVAVGALFGSSWFFFRRCRGSTHIVIVPNENSPGIVSEQEEE